MDTSTILNRNEDYDTTDYTDLGYHAVIFPSFESHTRKILFRLLRVLRIVGNFLDQSRSYLLLFQFAINVFHLTILLKKSMRNNAINIILAVMAINDLLTVIHLFLSPIVLYDGKESDQVRFPFIPVPDFLYVIVGGILKRNYSWLPILMTATRLIVIKHFDNHKLNFLTTGRFGLMSSAALVASVCIIALAVFLIMTEFGHTECLDQICNRSYYRIDLSEVRIHDVMDQVLKSLLPAVSYPILTFLLVRELRKAKTKIMTNQLNDKNDRTTKMMIAMTIFFMIPVFPHAIGTGLMLFYWKNEGLAFIGECLVRTVHALTSINSSAHCFICFFMSSNYKAEVMKVFGHNPENSAEVDVASPQKRSPTNS